MTYSSLENTGVKVSPLCIGMMSFGYRTDEKTAHRIIHKTIDEGINFIDTANLYGQPASEGRGTVFAKRSLAE